MVATAASALPAAPAAPAAVRWPAGLAYGALGAPLAFAALPLYVQLPAHYAATLGAPLAGLGTVLLATRAADALIDPALGRWSDRRLQGARGRTVAWAAGAALLLGLGLAALFFPPAGVPLLAWCAAALLVTSLGYSTLGVLHQTWGARLGGGDAGQARWAGWREGLALAGVLLASVLPALAGVAAMVAAAGVMLLLGLAALTVAPYPAAAAGVAHAGAGAAIAEPVSPWRTPAFRHLIAVFLLNGIASAVPATLVLFFVRDRLQAAAHEALFLGLYFAAAALAVPLWVRAVGRFGLARSWLAGMLLAVLSFVWAAGLGAGDMAGFALVCAASGLALGADLVAPPALLAGIVQRGGLQGHEGRFFGWWTCAAKLNLALAAGIALPMLALLGYRPGTQTPDGLQALTLAYAVLPCALKLLAAAWLLRQRHHLETR